MRSYSDLRKLRDEEIKRLASHKVSKADVKDIYHLSLSTLGKIAEFVKSTDPSKVVMSGSEKQTYVQQVSQSFRAQGLSDEEISFIFDHNVKLSQEKLNQLLNENEGLYYRLKDLTIQANYRLNTLHKQLASKDKELELKESKIVKLSSQISSLSKLTTDYLSQIDGLNSQVEALKIQVKDSQLHLEAEKIINKINTSNIDTLKADLESKCLSLSQLSDSLKREQELHSQDKTRLDSLEKEKNKIESDLKETSQELSNLKSDLSGLDSSNRSLKRENYLLNKSHLQLEKDLIGLREENARLSHENQIYSESNSDLLDENDRLSVEISSLSSLASETESKAPHKYSKVYDRDLIVSVYQSENYVLKTTYENLRNRGVCISYRHLSTILKEEKVYKRTYRPSKKKSSK